MPESCYLTDDHGVSKLVLQSGNGVFPKERDRVTVHYEGFLNEDMTKLDSSLARNAPFVFTLGEGKVIDGWEIAIKTMQVGEVCQVICSSQYGYGKLGRPPLIPPNATLQFTMTLLATEESLDSPAYRIRTATELKSKGNEWYKRGDMKNAIVNYSQAKDCLTKLDVQDTPRALLASILANLAACYLKLHDWKNTIECGEQVLKLDTSNAKVYYRLGQAYSETNNYEQAFHYVNLGLKNESNDISLQTLHKQLKEKHAIWRNKNKEKYKKLFTP